MHDDVVKKELLAELEEAKHDALCSSLQDIQAEMALWSWGDMFSFCCLFYDVSKSLVYNMSKELISRI